MEQSIFEFDPIEMMFGCLYLATKIDDIQFSGDIMKNIEVYCRLINEEKYCTIESKSIHRNNFI